MGLCLLEKTQLITCKFLLGHSTVWKFWKTLLDGASYDKVMFFFYTDRRHDQAASFHGTKHLQWLGRSLAVGADYRCAQVEH